MTQEELSAVCIRQKKEIDDSRAISCMQTISDYCANHFCSDCVFFSGDQTVYNFCFLLSDVPETWTAYLEEDTPDA